MSSQLGKRAARKAKDDEARATLLKYYATGGGSAVPVERVAAHLGISIDTARFGLRSAGRTV